MSITPEQLVADLYHFEHKRWAGIVEGLLQERNQLRIDLAAEREHLGIATVWHEGSESYYRARLLVNLGPELPEEVPE